MSKPISPFGKTWDEFEKTLYTPEEMQEARIRAALICELVRARQEHGLSQKKLEELSGVKQPVIARIEHGDSSPRLDTMIKVLAPLGKTLAVVPLKEAEQP
ncbi:MAG: helix-turn-helix transcriptional regulator [Clostridia bacterium]